MSSTGSASEAGSGNGPSGRGSRRNPVGRHKEHRLEKSSTDEKPKTKSDETRARILGAAMDLFRRRGFEETTMREIAAEAGVATGAAYYYFDSKDAIVLAFYDQATHELEPLLEEALTGSKDLRERLRVLLEI